MAYIRKRKLSDGRTSFQVCWTDPDGFPQTQQFGPGQSEAAKDRKLEVEHSMRSGTYIDPSAGRETFKSYAENWLSNQLLRDTSYALRESQLRLHLVPALGRRPMAAIKRSDIVALVKRLDARYAASSVHSIIEGLSAIFNAAVLDRIIAVSPCESIALPKVIRTDIVIPTVGQVREIDAAMPKHLRGLVLTAASTGLRLGELLGATLESAQLLKRDIVVRPDRGQLSRVPPYQLVPPKSAASARTVPLGDIAVGAISSHLAAFPARADDGYGGLIFQSVRSAPLARGTIGQYLRPLVAAHGFPERTGMHIFRHFYASALIAAGESPKVVQVRLGHATIAETMDTYGHLWPDSDELSRKAIDAAFGDQSITALQQQRSPSGSS